MLTPDFSESQLQAATNLAYAIELHRRNGNFPFPFVPSLPAELLLGWDTAFQLDWMPHRLPPYLRYQHKGCNFFLQYKLSDFIDGPIRAKAWTIWNKPYFRFRIPHRKKIGAHYYDDFHQWDRLKEISNTGAPTFYATNTTSTETDLKLQFDSGILLERIALLDIAPIKKKHIHATFSDPFDKFVLHSDPEEARLLSFSTVLESLSDKQLVSHEDGIKELTSIAEKLLRNDGSENPRNIKNELAAFQEQFISFSGRDSMPYLKRQILEALFLRHFGIKVHWYTNGS